MVSTVLKRVTHAINRCETWIEDLSAKSLRCETILLLIVGVTAVAVIVSHRPDALLNAQFWAEDGKVWYAEAYNLGSFVSMLKPVAGYFQTISRVTAAFAQLVPFAWAPLFMNLCAIAIMAGCASFIVSSRLRKAIPSLATRLFLGFIYLALPHSYETNANITNAQWHLALLAFLIIIATPAKSVAGKVFDAVAVTISAFSGPFCILLLPVVGLKMFLDRDSKTPFLAGILAIGAVVQIVSLLTTARPSAQPLGATPELFAKIVGGQIFFNSIFGDRNYGRLIKLGWWNGITAGVVCLIGTAILVLAMVKANLELRLLGLFSALIAAGALLSPAASSSLPQWNALWPASVGSRYWLMPSLCFYASIVSLAITARRHLVRYGFAGLLACSLIGIVGDWKHPRFTNLNFPEHARRFEQANPGETVTIPINPNWGVPWEMQLVKR